VDDDDSGLDGGVTLVFGLKEYAAKLEILERTIQEAGEDAGHRAAVKIAATARHMMPIGPVEGGHVRDSARAEGMTAIIGGAFFPYTGWLEFGGRVGKVDPATGRFGIWRSKESMGRYLWPSYLFHQRDVDEILDQETTEAIHQAGFEDYSSPFGFDGGDE